MMSPSLRFVMYGMANSTSPPVQEPSGERVPLHPQPPPPSVSAVVHACAEVSTRENPGAHDALKYSPFVLQGCRTAHV